MTQTIQNPSPVSIDESDMSKEDLLLPLFDSVNKLHEALCRLDNTVMDYEGKRKKFDQIVSIFFRGEL
jgi:hypothetical protein